MVIVAECPPHVSGRQPGAGARRFQRQLREVAAIVECRQPLQRQQGGDTRLPHTRDLVVSHSLHGRSSPSVNALSTVQYWDWSQIYHERKAR